MSTRTEIRSILGPLADVALPHLRGELVTVHGGRTAMATAHDAPIHEIVALALAAGPLRIGFVELLNKLFPYQRAGVRYALDARRAIIGHDMGLGKSVQAIASIAAAQTIPAVVICPPSLTLNWVNEFSKWAPTLVTHRIVGTEVYDLPKADVYVIGDAVLAPRDATDKQAARLGWVEPLISLDPRAIVVDEIQRFKNYKAQRTAAVKEIARYVDRSGLFLGLTGTLTKNNPMEGVAPLQIVGVFEALFGSDVKAFQERYYPLTGKDAYERKADQDAALELHAKLLDTCYARLEFAEVKDQMGDLAPVGEVVRKPVSIEMTGKAARDYKVARDDLAAFLLDNGYDEGRLDKAMRAEALVRLNTLRKLIGMAKLDQAVKYIADLVDEDEQVVVFANHRDITTTLAKRFSAPTIIGGMRTEDVERGKADFQSGKSKVIVLNIEAGGTGHTLTAARHVVFVEFGWTPADMEQAEARCYRIGQTREVVAHWLMGANGEPTIDARLVDILNHKSLITGAINKGKVETMIDQESVQSALLDWVMGR